MKLFERRTYDMKCNWKTYIDNYLEGYHLPSVHPALNRELDYNATWSSLMRGMFGSSALSEARNLGTPRHAATTKPVRT
jgi:phenylpropionate dioxygenase-like ring-hydroxylating dioxygenase large terminal subunit